MKDHLRHLVEGVGGDRNLKTLIAREYLQARILQSLQDGGAFARWAFLGGTALRFLYSLPRFSEDLAFSLVPDSGDPRFDEALGRVERMFSAEVYGVEVRSRPEKTVASAFIRFEGLSHELGLSTDRRSSFSIKVELDTNPPSGARYETTLVRRHVLLNIHHYDRASLLSGKLHALLSRPWCKGRDLFDLAWYLADRTWPGPNIDLLNASLAQTGREGAPLTLETWKGCLFDRLQTVDWDAARSDAGPFLERPEDADLIGREHILRLLR